jgi:hypothetical protein
MPRICVLIVAVLLIGGGCTQPPVEHTVRKVPVDEVRGDTEKAGEAANHVGEKEEKEDFERRLKARLTGIEAEIASLHERGLALKDEARTRWNDTMTDLKAKQKVAHEKLDEPSRRPPRSFKQLANCGGRLRTVAVWSGSNPGISGVRIDQDP